MLAIGENKTINRLENEISQRLAKLRHHDTKSIRSVRRDFSRELAKYPPKFVIALAMQLLRVKTVPRFLAYELVQHHPAAPGELHAKTLMNLGDGIADWAAVDCFACYLAGPTWREKQIPDALIERWA